LARLKWIENLRDEPKAIVLFEAPHRAIETIASIEDILVKRQIQIFREITKLNEEYVVRPNKSDNLDMNVISKGEFTIVVGPSLELVDANEVDQIAVAMLFNLIEESGLVPYERIMHTVASSFDLKADDVRKTVKKGKILAKRQTVSTP
jgi:16S rRNA C1402 (ribose-2'-O) methylase RsmI